MGRYSVASERKEWNGRGQVSAASTASGFVRIHKLSKAAKERKQRSTEARKRRRLQMVISCV